MKDTKKEVVTMNKGGQINKLGEVCEKASSNIAQNKIENDNGDYPIYGASGFGTD